MTKFLTTRFGQSLESRIARDTKPKEDDTGIIALLRDLRNDNEAVRQRTADNLRLYVGQQARDMSPEQFKKLLNVMTEHIFDLITSSELQDRIAGTHAIECLIDVEFQQSSASTKLTRMSNYLRQVLESNEAAVLELAASTLGKLVRVEGTVTAEIVDEEMKKALVWLSPKEQLDESRRMAAVLILKELAVNAPSLFYVHVSTFFDLIWTALKDSKLAIRAGAAEALGAALELTASRKTRQRSQWHDSIWQESLSGLKSQSLESVHGSILAVAELLKHAKDFMISRYKLVCEAVLKQKDFMPKGRYSPFDAGLVKRTVMEMIPIMGGFLPEMFATHYCRVCVEYLLSFVNSKDEDDRGTAFAAIGALSRHVPQKVVTFMSKFLEAFDQAISSRRTYCISAVLCFADIASVARPDIRKLIEAHVKIKNLMLHASLDAQLMDALQKIANHVPLFMQTIQVGLIKLIAYIITKKNYTIKLSQISDKKQKNKDKEILAIAEQFNYARDMSTLSIDEDMILLALKTLGTFGIDKEIVLDFTREVVVDFLDHDNPLIRKQAAITCAAIVKPVEKKISPMASAVINQVIEKLLLVGIGDTEPSLRITVLDSLDSQFDVFLALPENLRSLFIALNDEIFEMRMHAIQMIGRLTIRNPAYVMPSMRKTLVQLLTELEFTGVSGNKEESASLLGHLIGSSKQLIRPYAKPIVKALLPKLDDENARVASTVLQTLGALSVEAGDIMEEHLPRLMPIIIESLQDQSSTRKRHIALIALGQFVQSTGRAITPFDEYPRLMDILLGMVKSERLQTMRQQLLKVLGILGALDPYRYVINQSGRSDMYDDAEEPDILASIKPSSDEYAPTAAVTALMRVMGDPSLKVHHNMVIKALIETLSLLPPAALEPLVPLFMPPFLHLVRTSEAHLKGGLLENLVELVGLVREHMHNYLGQVFELIREYWNTETTNLVSVLSLIELISLELGDIFRVYLPDLIPQMLAILHSDYGSDDWEATVQVLHTLEIVGKHLDDYIHLVVPAIVRLTEISYCPVHVRKAAISALARLSFVLSLEDYASRISHPLARILETQVALRDVVMDTLCALVYQLGTNYAIAVPIINKVLLRCSITNQTYDNLVAKLLNNVPLQDPPADFLARIKGRSESVERPVVKKQDTGSLRTKSARVNQQALRQAWKTSNRQTKEDWIDWMRKLSVELLRNSSSPVLRSCLSLAQVYHPLATELFNPAFLSCWNGIDDQFRDQLVQSLKNALNSAEIPPEIMQIILNCFEWMERDGGKRMINIQDLGAFGEKCHAYAKALHYKEIEFRESSTIESDVIEALISINNQLQQPEAAVGILTYAQKNREISFSASWYEKLRRWNDALQLYQNQSVKDSESVLGQIRCYSALSEWDKVVAVSQEAWKEEQHRPAIAPLAAAASWHLADWQRMAVYVKELDEGFEGSFYRAILAVQAEEFTKAQRFIDSARLQLDNELTVLVGESYNRAYDEIVRVQQLSELEEIILYKQARDSPETRSNIVRMWERRLDGVQRNVDVWDDILSVRALVLSPKEEPGMWLKYSGLCRKGRALPTSRQILTSLFPKELSKVKAGKLPKSTPPRIVYGYLQQLWAEGAQQEAYDGMTSFSKTIKDNAVLMARCHLKLGKWRRARQDSVDEAAIPSMIKSFRAATQYNGEWYKAWYEWAFINFEILSLYDQQGKPQQQLREHLIAAIEGFFQSIALSPGQSLQDTLRLLTLWFKYGDDAQAIAALKKGFDTVSIDTWLQVIPQIIARIHSQSQKIRDLIQQLLIMVGRAHPQALVYPMTVASKSQGSHVSQSDATQVIINDMKKHSALLVEQAEQVSHELIRISIVWHEMWHEALEEASRFYFTNNNADAMIERLQEMHQFTASGPETLREVAFYQTFGRDLEEAREWSVKFMRSREKIDINQAWDLYSGVFKRIVKLLPHMKSFDLQYVSPYLLHARDLNLAVPGTYRANAPVVMIKSFGRKLKVFSSKQRPRHTTIDGSDNVTYSFLLKGHEDLRQDERVMQLFGLVNTLLANDPDTSRSHLMISRYSVIPLSPNSGLIGWVPNCDTLLKLIQDYREERGLELRYEHNRILKLVSQKEYDSLTLIQKVEAFEHSLNGDCDGHDIDHVLWLKSRNSESWLDRRTTYTRSLAMMSIVGYILGLGDRHPSNLMLNKINGKIVHIDFGDCFEVAMLREKYPEKIPFRLTRMLIYAMEAGGIEGNFRSTCENVMRVLRDHKESVMAVLEAFVHDPLLNWRLLNTRNEPSEDSGKEDDDSEDDQEAEHSDLEMDDSETSLNPSGHSSMLSGTKSFGAAESEAPMPEVLNEKAVTVINRVKEKLTGTDFKPEEKLEVAEQVAKLIEQATSSENLCQGYFGWCPFW